VIYMPLVVAFEGIAGTGKTTVSKMFATEFPDTMEIIDEFPKSFINDYMRELAQTDPEFRLSKTTPTPLSQTFLFATNAAFKMETARHISHKPIVIMDRYKHSITAHQSIILAESNSGIDHKLLLDGIITALPDPDVIIYFEGAVDLMRARLTNRSEIYNDAYFSFIGQTRAAYETIMANCKVPTVRLPAINGIDENYRTIKNTIIPMISGF
jgi:thymidylate kinase